MKTLKKWNEFVNESSKGIEIATIIKKELDAKNLKGMKHIKTFENYSDTNPDVIVRKEINNYYYQQESNPKGEFYLVDKTGLEGIMYYYFKEKNDIIKGDDMYEIKITYDYQHLGDINPEDIKNAIEYLESMPGVETVIHRVGQCFEITFEKPVEFSNLIKPYNV